MKQLVCILVLAVGCSTFAFQKQTRGSVTGKVLTLSGEPVVGAKIAISFEGDPELEKYNKTGIKTKKNGGFVQVGLPSGNAVIYLEKEGYVSRTYNYVQDQSRQELKIRMLKEGESVDDLGPQPNISGVIVDSAGKPIPAVDVKLSSQDFPGYEKTFTTNEDGTFSFPGIANAAVQLHANKSGYRGQILKIQQGKGEFVVKAGEYAMLTIEEAGGTVVQQELSQRDKAIVQYNEAVDPYQKKRYDEAEEYAKKSFEIDNTFEKAAKLVVYTNYFQQDWPEVVTFGEQYMALKPDDTDMLKIVVEAAQKSQNEAKLSQFKSKLRELQPVTPDSLYSEVIEALNANDDDTAKTKCQEILKMNNSYPLAYYELGRIMVREGDFDAAVQNLKLYLKHAPKDHKFRSEATELIVTLSE